MKVRGAKLKIKMLAESRACHYCRCVMTRRKHRDNSATLDHIKPVSKGGDNSVDNLVLCCQKCNFQKKDMSYGEFLSLKYGHLPVYNGAI